MNKIRVIIIPFLIVFFAASSSFCWKPMEPAKKTLIVMVAGINPLQGGLFMRDQVPEHFPFNIDPSTPQTQKQVFEDFRPVSFDAECNDDGGHAHIFRTYLLRGFLEKNVIGNTHHVYARALSEPNKSPVELAEEIGERNWSLNRNCAGKRIELNRVNGQIEVESQNVDQEFNYKNVLEDAVMNWLDWELRAYLRDDPEADPDIKNWILASEEAQNRIDAWDQNSPGFGLGLDGVLELLRRQEPELIPSRYITIVHSMGGNIIKEYIVSDYYQGDIDKVITLDSPHEGSYATKLSREILDYSNIGISASKQAVWGGIGGAILWASDTDALDKIGMGLVIYAAAGFGAEMAIRHGAMHLLTHGYGFDDGANTYLIAHSGDLNRINSITSLPTPYDFPAHRIFHLQGAICAGDPDALLASGWEGYFIPNAVSDFSQNVFLSLTRSYEGGIDLKDKLGNALLAGLLGTFGKLNFSEQGSSVVPAWSSKGENVQLFNQPFSDVRRKLYKIDPGSGELGITIAAKYGLMALTGGNLARALNSIAATLPPAQKAIVKLTKFPVLMTYAIAESFAIAAEVADATGNVYADPGVLYADGFKFDGYNENGGMIISGKAVAQTVATSHDWATIYSHKKPIESKTINQQDGSLQLSITPLEDFLYEKPFVSLQMGREDGNVLVGIQDHEGRSIYSLNENYLEPIDYTQSDWQGRMAIKEEVQREIFPGNPGSPLVRDSHRYFLPGQTVVSSSPERFAFTVDDFRPDLLLSISVSINGGDFQVRWDRKPEGVYSLYKKIPGGNLELVATGQPSPISAKGNWLFSPSDYFNDFMFRDGQNAVSLLLVNNIGLSNVQKFYFLSRLTEALIVPNWIRYYSVVSSNHPTLDVDVNALAYPSVTISASQTGFRIYPRNESENESGTGIPLTPFNQPPPSDFQGINKNFRHIWPVGQSAFIEEGNYWFEVEVALVVGDLPAGTDKIRLPFTYDNTPPELTIIPISTATNPGVTGPVSLRYTFTDPPLNQIQTGRIQLLDASSSVIFEFLPFASSVAGGGTVLWNGLKSDGTSVDEGFYRFRVTARDASMPDKDGILIVEDLFDEIGTQTENGTVSGEFNTLWSRLLSHGGFQLAQRSADFFVDKTPPLFEIEADLLTSVKNGEKQKFSYKVADASYAVPGSTVKLKWAFIAKAATMGVDYVHPYGQEIAVTTDNLSDASSEGFEEIAGLIQFSDGKYEIHVEVSDQAGNTSTFQDPGWTFCVDRTSPQIIQIFLDDDGTDLNISWDVIEPNDHPWNITTKEDLRINTVVSIKSPSGDEFPLTAAFSGGKFRASFPQANLDLDGAWLVEIQTSDEAGNIGKDAWIHNVGTKPPMIVSPSPGAVSGQVAISGLARSPVTGKEFSAYELWWSDDDGTTWKSDGIEVPISRRSHTEITNRSVISMSRVGYLGSWDTRLIESGTNCQLKLISETTDGIKISSIISEYYVTQRSTDEEFSIDLVNPPHQYEVPGGALTFGLKINSSAKQGTEYFARIIMKDSENNPLIEDIVSPLMASRYVGAPSDVTTSGVYLWFSDNLWNLHVSNAPRGYKFFFNYNSDRAPDYSCTTEFQCEEKETDSHDVSVNDGPTFGIWNKILEITVDAGKSGDFALQLPSIGSFMAMLKEPNEEEDPLMPSDDFYMGGNAERDESISFVTSIKIDPVPFSYTVTWDGLQEDGTFPANGIANIQVILEEKSSGQVRQIDQPFNIITPDFGLDVRLSSEKISFDPENEILGKITAYFDIKGKNAMVTAAVKDPSGNIVKELISPVLYKTRNQSYAVSWNGIKDNHTGVNEGEIYRFYFRAWDPSTGEEKEVYEPFTVESVKWIDVGGSNPNFALVVEDAEYNAELAAEVVQPRPYFKVIAQPHGSAADVTSFNYSVNYSGTQSAVAYPSERFDAFIRRQRQQMQFVLVMKLRITERGENYLGLIKGCKVTRRIVSQYFAQQITINRGESIEIETGELAPDQGEETKWVYRCLISGCAADLDKFVEIRVLPNEFLYLAEELLNMPDPDLQDQLWDGLILKEAQFDLSEAKNSRFQLYDTDVFFQRNTESGWTTVETSGGGGDEWIIENALGSGPVNGCGIPEGDEDEVLSKGDHCDNGNEFNPHRNLLDIGFKYRAGQSDWAYSEYDYNGCSPNGHRRAGFVLKIKVPEEYWNPPFGYNNWANACLRFDPTNQWLYNRKGTGFFSYDGFDNNGNCVGGIDPRCINDDEWNGYLTPFNTQTYRWSPVVRAVVSSGESSAYGNVQGFRDALNFGDNDHSFYKSGDKLQIGFNLGPAKYGTHAKFEMVIRKETCKGPVFLMKQNLACPDVSLEDITVIDNQWMTGDVESFYEMPLTPEGAVRTTYTWIGPFPFPVEITAVNLQFEVRLRVRPDELWVQALYRRNLNWPFDQSNFSMVQSSLSSDADAAKLYLYKGVSGIRFGIFDGLNDIATIPSHFNNGGVFVDETGYFRTGINPDQLPSGSSENTNISLPCSGILTPDGSGHPVFRDEAHFAKLGQNYSHTQGGFDFGSNVSVTNALVSAPAGIELLGESMVSSANGFNFGGGTVSPWSGINDPNLVSRDLDLDARTADEDILDMVDNDGDGSTDEDPPGTLVGLGTFNAQAQYSTVNLLSLYPSGVEEPENSNTSLMHYTGSHEWIRNDLVSNLGFSNVSVRYINGELHEDLEVIAQNEIEGEPVELIIGSKGFAMEGGLPKQVSSRNFKRPREYMVIKGNVPGRYQLAFLNSEGGFTIFANNMPAPIPGGERILGYLDVNRIQGSTSIYLIRRTGSEIQYSKADVFIGTPVSGSVANEQIVSSLYQDAEVIFPTGSVVAPQTITLRVTNPADAGFTNKNKVSVVGPVIEVLPSQHFDSSHTPLVKIRIDRYQLDDGSGALNPVPSELHLYKSDLVNETFTELLDLEYIFKDANNNILCQNDNGEECDGWRSVTLTGKTQSFSNIFIMEENEVENRDYEILVDPLIGVSNERSLSVDGLDITSCEVYVDDDDFYSQDEDVSPPIFLTPARISEQTATHFSADYDIPFHFFPEGAIVHLMVVPRKDNGIVKTAQLRLLEENFVFNYAGEDIIYAGTVNGNVRIPYITNHPGTMELTYGKNSTIFGVIDGTISMPSGSVEDKTVSGGFGLESGSYNSTIIATSVTGAVNAKVGPVIMTDAGLPIGAINASGFDFNGGRAYVFIPDFHDEETEVENARLTVFFNSEVLLEQSVVSGAMKYVLLPELLIQSCFDCKVHSVLDLIDKGGNTARVEWFSPKVGRVPETSLSFGITSPAKILPASGIGVWTEEKLENGNDFIMESRKYNAGMACVADASDVLWQLYHLEPEAERLDVPGIPLLLKGIVGTQDGSEELSVFIKVSYISVEPSLDDWINNTGSVIEVFNLNSRNSQELFENIMNAKWVWLGVQTDVPDINTHGIFANLSVIYGGLPEKLNEKVITLNTTFSGADVAEDIKDFPVLLKLNSDNFDFASAEADGRDVRFETTDRTPLPFQIVSWSSEAENAEIWVRTDIKGNSISTIRLVWGDERYPGYSGAENVFNVGSNFIGVWHLDDASDATSNFNDGIKKSQNEPQATQTDCAIGGCQYFDGYNDYIEIPYSTSLDMGGVFTASFWIKNEGGEPSFDRILSRKAHWNDYGGWEVTLRACDNDALHILDAENSFSFENAVSNWSAGRWEFITVVFNHANIEVFSNGKSTGLKTNKIGAADNGLKLVMGDNVALNDNNLFGKLDEVRLSAVARSPGWIKLCYENQKEFQTFVSYSLDPVEISDPSALIDGLVYRYFEGSWNNIPDYSTLSPINSGVTGQISLAPRMMNDNFGFEYSGYVHIPTEGLYTFYTKSDDGSALYLNGVLIVDNDGRHAMRERSGGVYLVPGYYIIEVEFFEASGDQGIEVYMEGPGMEKSILPSDLLDHAPEQESSSEPIPPGSTTVTASTSYCDNTPAKAFDGNVSTTRWESVHNSDPQWLSIDLGSEQAINRVTIDWELASAADYTLQCADNNGNWSVLATRSDMPAEQHRMDIFDNLTGSCRILKIHGTERSYGYGYSIWDVHINQ